MQIRPARIEDQPEWLRLRAALWPACPREKHLAEMAEFSGAAAQVVLVVVRSEGGLGGFLEAGLRPYAEGCETRPVGYIEGWYVDPDLRRQGVGGELVRAAEDWAIAQGCQEMASDCMIDNETSRRAHLALDYQEAGRLIAFKKRLRTP